MAKKITKKHEKIKVAYASYCMAGIILISVLLIAILGYHLYKLYDNNKGNTSYLLRNNLVTKEIKLEEYKDVFANVSGDYFLVLSYTGSKEMFEFESNLRTLINDYNLISKTYYINLTDIKNNEDVYDVINSNLGLTDFKVTQIPTIIYVNKNKEVVRNNIISREDGNMITEADFQQLLDINGFEK